MLTVTLGTRGSTANYHPDIAFTVAAAQRAGIKAFCRAPFRAMSCCPLSQGSAVHLPVSLPSCLFQVRRAVLVASASNWRLGDEAAPKPAEYCGTDHPAAGPDPWCYRGHHGLLLGLLYHLEMCVRHCEQALVLRVVIASDGWTALAKFSAAWALSRRWSPHCAHPPLDTDALPSNCALTNAVHLATQQL